MDIMFDVVSYLIGLLPEIDFELPGWADETLALLSKALMVFPADVWIAIIFSVGFWTSIHFSWAIIEWLYKKIPGVD